MQNFVGKTKCIVGYKKVANCLFFVSCEEKYCYLSILVGQLGLTAAHTAGTATATVVLSK